MNAFTLAYLSRLELWGLGAAFLQGMLILASWNVWERAAVKAGAGLRHRLACAHFVALAVLPALTVLVLHSMIGHGALSTDSPVRRLPPLTAGFQGAFLLALPLSILWFAGAAVMAARLLAEARGITRSIGEPAPAAMVEAVRRAGRNFIGAGLPYVRVSDVASPQIVGLWRPVLLAPHDLIQRLPPAECEAVLLHELAHMRRHDFQWNLLQRFLLVVLWFHPAAWRLYGHVAREREVCCDDMAVRYGASPAALARALVHLTESGVRPELRMGISSRCHLAVRVQRLIGLHASPTPAGGLHAAGVVLSGFCVMTLSASGLALSDSRLHGFYNASIFGPTISIDARDPAGRFALRIRQGRVIEASIEERRLPEGHILQRGPHVTLLGNSHEPVLALTVAPQGTISWQSR